MPANTFQTNMTHQPVRGYAFIFILEKRTITTYHINTMNILKRNKKTIGYFITQLHDHYQSMISPGIIDCANDNGYNLIAFVGKSLNTASKIDSNEQVIFNLANEYNIDGLLIITAALGNYITQKELQAFCGQFKPLPIVCLSTPVEGFTSISCDNEKGMREIATHFVKDHQYKRIAFISGPARNPESQVRFQVFREVLDKYNVPFYPELYYEGTFLLHSGIEAVKTFLDDRKVTFDAILAVNDETIIGAYRELDKRGIKVPDEVALGGFDNISKTKIIKPQITTVSQQLYQESYKAIEILINSIEKKAVKLEYTFPAKLIIRQSCGCNTDNFSDNNFYSAKNQKAPAEITVSEDQIQSFIQETINEIEQEQDMPRETQQFQSLIPQFIEAYFYDLKNRKSRTFFEKINHLNMSANKQNNFLILIKDIVKKLYNKTGNLFASSFDESIRAFELYHEIRHYVNDLLLSNTQNMTIEKSDYNFTMLKATKKLSITFKMNELKNIIFDLIPSLNIDFCFIALFENTENMSSSLPQKARTFIHYQASGETSQNSNVLFETKHLVPKNIRALLKQGNFAIFPLVSEYDQFGYIIFDYKLERDSLIYETIQGHISASLKSTLLFETIQKQKGTLSGFINSMSLLVEARDPYTAGHQIRVADLAREIAVKIGLSKVQTEAIRIAGILHDIGKLYIPSQILNKPGKLTPIEFELIKIHPHVAYNILKSLDFNWPIADIVLQHHERLNGSGYPAGLKAKNIMIEAQILSVADVVEAMMSHRPFRQSLGIKKTLNEITTNKNTLYNSSVVDCCISLLTEDNFEFKEFTNSFQDQ